MKSIINKKNLAFLIVCLAFFGCVETFELDLTNNQKITIIEGILSNATNDAPILLKESTPSATGSTDIRMIVGAKVSVLVNDKTIINLQEKKEGNYYYPENFVGEIGSTYQLKFTTTSGEQFASLPEKLLKPTPIGSVYDKLEVTGISDAKGKTSPAFYVYLDTPNAPETEDYFMWEWTLYEKNNVCQTCTGGYYYKDPLPLGRCQSDPILARQNNIFDYACDGSCWEIVNSTSLNIGSDQFYNGNNIKGQLIAKIPLYSQSSALIDVKQYSISKDVYKFLDLTRKQGVQTGGLADTPPASLIGNVKSLTNPADNVSGYFIVAGVEKSLYWLDKKALEGKGLPIYGLLGGRAIKYEPSGSSTTRPPLAPCIISKSRTNIQPKGWIN